MKDQPPPSVTTDSPSAHSLCHPSSSPLILPLSNPSPLFHLTPNLISFISLLSSHRFWFSRCCCVFSSQIHVRGEISLRSEPGSATAGSMRLRLSFTLHGRGAEVTRNPEPQKKKVCFLRTCKSTLQKHRGECANKRKHIKEIIIITSQTG